MMPQPAPLSRIKATNFERFAAAFVDGTMLLPVYVAVMFATNGIPYLGTAIVSLVGAGWWLLRDATGLSIGKKTFSLEVISKNGAAASRNQLIKRNYTLAAAMIFGGIPMTGLLNGGFVTSKIIWEIGVLGVVPIVGKFGGFVSLVEGAWLLFRGERYGDRLANTAVVKKLWT